MATKALLTIEEYEQLPVTGVRTELVDGEVIELATGNLRHDVVRDNIRTALFQSVAGLAVTEREFRTVNGKVRRADVVWYAPARIASADLDRSMSPLPDLAVEIVSPNDLASGVRKKVREYVEAGIAAVWMIYLDERLVDIWNHGSMTTSSILTADCLPGFQLPLDDVFPRDLQ